MEYFGDINRRAYYLRAGKNGKKIYNFDDLVECGDLIDEAHMDDEQPMGVPHDVPGGDVVMQDSPHGYAHGSDFGTGYGDTSSIMTMLQNMQLRKNERYVEYGQMRYAFEAAQMERSRLM